MSEPAQVWEVSAASEGRRLDVFVCERAADLGRAALKRLAEQGLVRIDGRRARVGDRLRIGQQVSVHAELSVRAQPDPNAALSIAHEDPHLVIVDKPAGMPTHPLRPGELGTLASALLARFPEMANFGYRSREPGIVHRLDTDTSGLVLAARSAEVFEALRAELVRGRIDKRYLALCAGPLDPQRIGCEQRAWLRAQGRRVRVVVAEPPDATFTPITTEIVRATPCGPGHSLLELRVAHARRHQVRAHLAALGHPLAGDLLYGGPAIAGLSRHFLHASALALTHPVTAQPVTATSALPAELAAVVQRVSCGA